jgi:hypothetical protein
MEKPHQKGLRRRSFCAFTEQGNGLDRFSGKDLTQGEAPSRIVSEPSGMGEGGIGEIQRIRPVWGFPQVVCATGQSMCFRMNE